VLDDDDMRGPVAWTDKGYVIAVKAGIGRTELEEVARDGTRTALPCDSDKSCFGPAWSPKTHRLLFLQSVAGAGDRGGRVVVLDKDFEQQAVGDASDARDPEWGPDGRAYAYLAGTDAEQVQLWVEKDGEEPRQVKGAPAGPVGAPGWGGR
jgi:hypothetical protein